MVGAWEEAQRHGPALAKSDQVACGSDAAGPPPCPWSPAGLHPQKSKLQKAARWVFQGSCGPFVWVMQEECSPDASCI